MKHLLLLPIIFILLQEYRGGNVWIVPEKIQAIYSEFEGSRIKLDGCYEILVEESVEEVRSKVEEMKE